MALNNFLKIFMPKNRIFYDLFEKAADNVAKMGTLLRHVVGESDFDKRGALIMKVEEMQGRTWSVRPIKFVNSRG